MQVLDKLSAADSYYFGYLNAAYLMLIPAELAPCQAILRLTASTLIGVDSTYLALTFGTAQVSAWFGTNQE